MRVSSLPQSPAAPPPAPPAPPTEATREEGHPRWPLWTPAVALVFGFGGGLLVTGILLAALEASGVSVDDDTPGFNAAATALIDICFVAAVVGVAAMVSRPAPWQFGLRRGPLGTALLMAFIGVLAFFVFEIAYAAIFQPDNPQQVVDDLGANRSTGLLVLGAFLVIWIAPVCEEIVFRGFLFRVLRVRLGFWLAAVIDGVLFGLVHGSLVILPVLAFLGVVLCWVYERTGTLFAPIAIHALNNAIAYGATTDDGWVAAAAVGAGALAACMLVPRLLPARTPAPV
jgi:uncharacterized protein